MTRGFGIMLVAMAMETRGKEKQTWDKIQEIRIGLIVALEVKFNLFYIMKRGSS